MSRYARLVCDDCGLMLWLGKIVQLPTGHGHFFHTGGDLAPPNSKKTELNRALWKMLATCGPHGLRVVDDQDLPYGKLDTYIEIGGDGKTDIPFEIYLKEWPGRLA